MQFGYPCLFSEAFRSLAKDFDVPYDVIVLEQDNEVIRKYTKVPVLVAQDHGFDFALTGSLAQALQGFQHPLVCISHLRIQDVLPLFEELHHITLVNMYAGVSSLVHKIVPEYQDVETLYQTQIPLYEPCDVEHFLLLLQRLEKKYIRLPYQELSHSVITDFLSQNNYTFPQKNDGLSSCLPTQIEANKEADRTILTAGGLLPEVIRGCDRLAREGIGSDFFVIQSYNFASIPEYVLDHLRRTKSLCVRCDHVLGESVLQVLHQTLATHHISLDRIKISSPKVSAITSHITEYLYEQAGVDAEKMVETIQAG